MPRPRAEWSPQAYERIDAEQRDTIARLEGMVKAMAAAYDVDIKTLDGIRRQCRDAHYTMRHELVAKRRLAKYHVSQGRHRGELDRALAAMAEEKEWTATIQSFDFKWRGINADIRRVSERLRVAKARANSRTQKRRLFFTPEEAIKAGFPEDAEKMYELGMFPRPTPQVVDERPTYTLEQLAGLEPM